MKLVHDGPAYAEPHDCVVLPRDLIHPSKIDPRTGPRYDYYEKLAKEDGVNLLAASQVIRKGPGKVRVYMVSVAPAYSLRDFRVKSGDEVQVIQTNLDGVEDLSHGFCMSNHDVNMVVNPRGTNSITFTAGASRVRRKLSTADIVVVVPFSLPRLIPGLPDRPY